MFKSKIMYVKYASSCTKHLMNKINILKKNKGYGDGDGTGRARVWGYLLVSTELGGVQQGAVVEELLDELRSTHAGVAVGEGDERRHPGHHQHLHDGVVAQEGGLTWRRGGWGRERQRDL